MPHSQPPLTTKQIRYLGFLSDKVPKPRKVEIKRILGINLRYGQVLTRSQASELIHLFALAKKHPRKSIEQLNNGGRS